MENFDIKIGDSDFLKGKISISITYNGVSWDQINLLPKELEILRKKIVKFQEERGFDQDLSDETETFIPSEERLKKIMGNLLSEFKGEDTKKIKKSETIGKFTWSWNQVRLQKLLNEIEKVFFDWRREE